MGHRIPVVIGTLRKQMRKIESSGKACLRWWQLGWKLNDKEPVLKDRDPFQSLGKWSGKAWKGEQSCGYHNSPRWAGRNQTQTVILQSSGILIEQYFLFTGGRGFRGLGGANSEIRRISRAQSPRELPMGKAGLLHA